MRPTLKYAVPAAAGLLILYFAVTRIMDALRTDESRVRLVFREVAEYARARDAGGVLEYLDPAYRDPQGFTAPEVRRIVRAYLANAESVEAELEPVGIEGLRLEGDEADVLVRARVVVRMPGSLRPAPPVPDSKPGSLRPAPPVPDSKPGSLRPAPPRFGLPAADSMPGGGDLGLDDAKIRGEYLIVSLRRHESYFRAKSVRPADPEEVRTP